MPEAIRFYDNEILIYIIRYYDYEINIILYNVTVTIIPNTPQRDEITTTTN